MKPLRVLTPDLKIYQMPPNIPEWGKTFEVLLRTRRRKRYYIAEGTCYGCKWYVKGFIKFKIIGYKQRRQCLNNYSAPTPIK